MKIVYTLPSSDMKSIDEAIAKTVVLMGYYADISRKLDDKLSYENAYIKSVSCESKDIEHW